MGPSSFTATSFVISIFSSQCGHAACWSQLSRLSMPSRLSRMSPLLLSPMGHSAGHLEALSFCQFWVVGRVGHPMPVPMGHLFIICQAQTTGDGGFAEAGTLGYVPYRGPLFSQGS